MTLSTPGAGLRPGLRNATLLGLAVALGVVALDRADLHGMAGALRDLPAGVAISASVHLPQLLFTAWAWRALLNHPATPSPAAMMALRWYRESAGTLLPGGGLLGQVAAARLLVRRGVPAELAGATATVDVTVEAVAQLLFTLAGLALLLARGGAGGVARLAAVGIAVATLAAAGLIALQRAPGHPWLATRLQRLALRLPPGWRRGLGDIHRAVLRLHADPRRLAAALAWHSTAWALGAVEVVAVLGLLGRHVTLAEALIVESTAQALRNAGFMLPGALGVQEGAFVGAAALVGIPAGPALAAALVRRAREVLLALPGLLAWQRAEAAPAAGPARVAVSAPPVR